MKKTKAVPDILSTDMEVMDGRQALATEYESFGKRKK
jgi:hypothetical protein